jgi:hypothetical protein
MISDPIWSWILTTDRPLWDDTCMLSASFFEKTCNVGALQVFCFLVQNFYAAAVTSVDDGLR